MSIKSILSTVAPWLATAASLTGTPAAGAAIQLAAKALGLTEETQEAVEKALASGPSPEQLSALQAANNEYQLRMQSLGFENLKDMEALSVQDRSSAREHNVKAGNADKVFWLTCVIVLIVVAIEGYVLINGLPSSSSPELLGRVLGTLDSIMMAAIFYTYGSTRGSAVKTDLLANRK